MYVLYVLHVCMFYTYYIFIFHRFICINVCIYAYIISDEASTEKAFSAHFDGEISRYKQEVRLFYLYQPY